MVPLDNVRALNGAPSQRDRLAAAPMPATVEVDGRSLADLLAFAGEYGALITFYDLSNEPDSDWSIFFLSDPAIAQARYASLDLDEIRAAFDQILVDLRMAGGAEERLDRLRPALIALLRLIRILTLGNRTADGLERALTGLLTSERRDILATPARGLAMHLGGSQPEDLIRRDPPGWFTAFLDRLEDLFSAILTALGQGREAALLAMERSFEDQSHAPQSGLYDAFATLFRHAQKSINSFPARLIDFYQSDVLRQTGRAGTPDTVCLTFTPANGVTHVELPAGTRFLAGTDADGQDIAYALDAAFTVDLASVAALRTLTVTTEGIGTTPSLLPAQVLSGIATLSDKPPAIATPFPLFGAAYPDREPGQDGVLTTTKATIGFAIASPTLMLTGGTRGVTIGLTIAPDSLTELTATLKAIATAVGGIAPEDVFVKLLQAAFALRYSTAGGWVDIAHYEVTPPSSDYPLFTLSFLLDTDADPLVALSTQPAATDATAPAEGSAVPDTDMPTVIADLLQEPVKLGPDGMISVYPYALLSTMQLSALMIDVEVVGLADLQASTPTGPVDTSQPFLMFGSPPVQDATIEIATPELFIKTLNSFELLINWFGLPVTSTGFKGYYNAYVIDADGRTLPPGTLFDNQSFRATLDVFNPGLWDISDPPHYLFQTARRLSRPAPDAPVAPTTDLIATVESRVPPTYYDPALTTICLSLSEPKTAFGDVLYAPNVMAASVRLTAAASACAQQCGESDRKHPIITHLAPIITANEQAPDSTLEQSVRAAIQRAVANLDGAALEAIEEEIAANVADADTKADWRESLSSAIGEVGMAGFLQRLRRLWKPTPDVASVHASIDAWLAENAATIAVPESTRLGRARAMIDAASGAIEVQERAAGQPPAVARPVTAAGLRDIQTRLSVGTSDASDCINNCMKGTDLLGFPNQPWLPMAASIQVTYNADTSVPVPAVASSDDAAASATLFHLLPFDGVESVPWSAGDTVPLLTPIDFAGALEIGLSDPAENLSLLFTLAPPGSGWPTDTPKVKWEQSLGGTSWSPLTPLRDTTNNLRNSGIVSVTLSDAAGAQPWLRVSVESDPAAFPKLAGLTTNAAMATWVGPGGGSGLGDPLPAGTITKSVGPLPELGSIDQPMPSSGGSPAEIGAGFELWLAERLRHKDRGIQGWDYSRLALAAFPSLWQVAVIPASDGGTGPVPGNVWIVPVAGPRTPAISDPTIPACDATTLDALATYLRERVSPFIQLWVTNPPYLRLRVVAELVFTDDDTVKANKERLNEELIQYLSPWPSPALPPRPDDYYTRKEVAHFIRNRPYVRAILKLDLVPVTSALLIEGWHYLTSDIGHTIKASAQPSVEPVLPPRLSLTARPALSGDVR